MRILAKAALDVGITTLDTADVYSETKLQKYSAGLYKVYVGRALNYVQRCAIQLGMGKTIKVYHILENCHVSLRRLQTDYKDVYYAHRFDPTTPLEETMLAFADLVRQGKVLYIIASQPQYSMLLRVIESDVIPTCQSEGLGQVVWSPLAQGVLTGKYLPQKPVPAQSRANSPAGKSFFNRLAQR